MVYTMKVKDFGRKNSSKKKFTYYEPTIYVI